jgi:transcriptional regulator with XRE-family HTH domain
MPTLVAKLRAARLAAGLSQVELAAALGYERHSDISRIERGAQAPRSLDIVDRWFEVCGRALRVVEPEDSEPDARAQAIAARLLQVLPALPEALVEGVEHDLDLWESRYLSSGARERA